MNWLSARCEKWKHPVRYILYRCRCKTWNDHLFLYQLQKSCTWQFTLIEIRFLLAQNFLFCRQEEISSIAWIKKDSLKMFYLLKLKMILLNPHKTDYTLPYKNKLILSPHKVKIILIEYVVATSILLRQQNSSFFSAQIKMELTNICTRYLNRWERWSVIVDFSRW